MTELLSVAEMYDADQYASDAGISSEALMEAAGRQAATAILDRFGPISTVILCGPGNNGGDGFVIARYLKKANVNVSLALLGKKNDLRGDAANMATRWRGCVRELTKDAINNAELVVDALFGAGLSRPVKGPAKLVLEAAEAKNVPIVSVDIPSGVNGDSGQVFGFAPQATMTVTFFRPKSGHFLYPGRGLCGELKILNIGMPTNIIAKVRPQTQVNKAKSWLSFWPLPSPEGNKFSRGHSVVLSGGLGKTGAARLAAMAALRVGSGLVTVASPKAAVAENGAHLTAIMINSWRNSTGFRRLLLDPRRNAVCLGPGSGVGKVTRTNVLKTLELGKSVVLDADAITTFSKMPKTLFNNLHKNCILTPHQGEFNRLFKNYNDKLKSTREAAAKSGAVVLLKGPDTVIASPDGRALINANAPPELATAGSGDVLAGFCVGLLAQGVQAFEAAAAACWIHGAAGQKCGSGLIAEDLIDIMPKVLSELRA